MVPPPFGRRIDNKLRVYLHIPEDPQLKLTPVFPKGGEHFVAGSVQFVRWFDSVPEAGAATVSVQFSATGPNGPWTKVVKDAPNSNRFQWTVPAVNSGTCYLRYQIRSAAGSFKVSTLSPFSISTASN